MKKLGLIFGVALVASVIGALVTSQTVIMQRPLTSVGLTSGMSFGTAFPTVANDGRPAFDGEPFVLITNDSRPLLFVFNDTANIWRTPDQSFGYNVPGGSTMVNVRRQEFDESCVVREAADFTAELVSDAGVNIAWCPDDTLNVFEFRIDGAQASPFIVDGAGALDIDNDGADNEGVEIVVSTTSAPVGGVVDVGTTPTTYFQVGFTIASIDGTDNLQMGWKLAAAYVDDQVNNTINTGGQFHWNSAAGNCVITTQDDGTDAEDETTACDLSDAEEMHVRVVQETDGTYNFFFAATEAALNTATAVTKTNATGAAAAGDMMVPYISMLNDTAADAEVKILYVEIGEILS